MGLTNGRWEYIGARLRYGQLGICLMSINYGTKSRQAPLSARREESNETSDVNLQNRRFAQIAPLRPLPQC